MDKAPGISTLENVVLLASRLLLAWIFVHEGVFLAMNFAAASAGMAKAGVPALALNTIWPLVCRQCWVAFYSPLRYSSGFSNSANASSIVCCV
jgi:uncharacterized membrane protein YphA (DoxX/SURF4 family)